MPVAANFVERLTSRVTATRTGFSPMTASCSSWRGGSGTRRKSGIENPAHQMATLTKLRRVATSGSAKPNVPGARIHARLMASSSPPPRYPKA